MEIGATAYLTLALVALVVSGLTLYSGFGLGTLLMPAFALFFPLSVAIAATAVVHLTNNLFKLWILRRYVNWGIAGRFAIPAVVGAALGAYLLTHLETAPPLMSYQLASRTCLVTPVKLVIGILIALFALLELVPSLERRVRFKKEHLVLGAVLSGFFGGLSGHQGALRTAVLIRFGFAKQVFIATGVVCAVLVDLSRLAAYGTSFYSANLQQVAEVGGLYLVGFASLAAFLGAFLGSRLMHKVTMESIQFLVGIMLVLIALLLAAGIV